MDSAFHKFAEMKSNGRWDLMQKYLRGNENDLNFSCPVNRGIMKKKLSQDLTPGEKKKVKVI
jgi:hypothetical protein